MQLGTLLRGLFALLVLLATSPAMAVLRTWPGSAPCNGTLQACIDGAANGDFIDIATANPIDENLNLYERSLSLRAAPGFAPNLAPGRWISATTSSLIGDVTVRISGISLHDAYVSVRYSGTGTGTYDLRDLELEQSGGGASTYIEVEAAAGSVDATLYDNRIRGVPASLNHGLLRLNNRGAVLDAQVYYNQVNSMLPGYTEGAGIFVDETGGGSGTVKLHANTVRGAFSRSAIWISEGLFSSTASSFGARIYSNVVVGTGNVDFNNGRGIGLVVNEGSIDAQVINNTVSNAYEGVTASQWSGGGSGASISGVVNGNLLVANHGLFFNQPLAAGVTNDYNLINATSNNGLTLGSHTITAPAGLVAPTMPRLAAGSPAIDAADATTLGLGIIINGLPVTDADGLRRLKGPSPLKPDIGAYEHGDASFLHTATADSISGHITRIDDPATNGLPAVDPFATPNFTAGGIGPPVTFNLPYGTYYASGQWRLFNEDQVTPMPVGAHFNLFVPAPAGSGGGVFRHVATSTNTSAWSTQLDDSSVNDKPDRIVLVAQNYTAGAVYNPHPVGVYYFAFGGPGAWFVIDLDQPSGVDMPDGAGFSVYAQEPSPNAFRATKPTGGSGNELVLDHPLLNDTPCAQPMVTRMWSGAAISGNFDVYYTNGRWRIFSYGSPIAVGDQFNVLVNPAQVEACSDVIFADGFE